MHFGTPKRNLLALPACLVKGCLAMVANVLLLLLLLLLVLVALFVLAYILLLVLVVAVAATQPPAKDRPAGLPEDDDYEDT